MDSDYNHSKIRSTIEGGRGCNKCVPVLRGNGTKIAPTGYIFDQPPGGMSWVRGKLAGHVGGHVVLSPEEGVLVTSPGTESSYPRPSQLLNNSQAFTVQCPRQKTAAVQPLFGMRHIPPISANIERCVLFILCHHLSRL